MPEPQIRGPQIRGGAGPYETAAVLAAIQAALTEEADAASQPEPTFEPGAWVIAGRPRSVQGPRTDFRGLSPLSHDPEDEVDQDS